MKREFTVNRDDERGIHTIGWFEADGRMTIQVRQYLPDSFFKHIEAHRTMVESRKHSTQEHWRLVGMIPSVIADNVLVDGNGQRLEFADPERDKKIKRLLNDSEFRKLRVEEGTI